MASLILASTSAYRRALLARIAPDFTSLSPAVDETANPGEPPRAMAQRLAAAKANAVARQHPGAIVIGSDQVAERDGRPLGKPGDWDAAQAQLAASSGRELQFHTAVCVIAADGSEHHACDLTRVRFRPLSAAQIRRYLEREPAYDCAGGFKCEGLGIALFETIDSQDPTALIGLPLIATTSLLRAVGYDPLG